MTYEIKTVTLGFSDNKYYIAHFSNGNISPTIENDIEECDIIARRILYFDPLVQIKFTGINIQAKSDNEIEYFHWRYSENIKTFKVNSQFIIERDMLYFRNILAYDLIDLLIKFAKEKYTVNIIGSGDTVLYELDGY